MFSRGLEGGASAPDRLSSPPEFSSSDPDDATVSCDQVTANKNETSRHPGSGLVDLLFDVLLEVRSAGLIQIIRAKNGKWPPSKRL